MCVSDTQRVDSTFLCGDVVAISGVVGVTAGSGEVVGGALYFGALSMVVWVGACRHLP